MKDDRKTTQIPSFLTGGSTDSDMENTVEVPVPEEPVRVVKQKRKNNSEEDKHVPAPLDNVVRTLSMAVIVALVIYIVFNLYLALFGASSDSKERPKQTAAPVDTTKTVEPTPVPSTGTVVNTGTVGNLTVNVDAITMRNDASLNAAEMGTVYYGEQYQVYEVREADGYTWYLIDQTNGGWVASDGTWVTYTQN